MVADTRVGEANPAGLRELSDWVRSFALAGGLPAARADAVEQCLNEAIANVLVHGYRDRPSRPITIRLERPVGGGLQMTIEDVAPPFNPLEHPRFRPATSIDEASIGGYGIHLLRTLASALHYRREEGRNVLSILFERE